MFNFFGNNQQQQPQKQQPANGQQQQNNNNNQQQQNNNVDPNALKQGSQNNSNGNGNQNSNPNEPANPLDVYSKMFDNSNTQDDKPPVFALDPTQMDTIVKGQNFAQGLNPEMLQKLQAGDWSVFPEILNSVGQAAYRSAIEHGGVLNSKFVEAREGHSSKNLPSKLRSELTNQALANTPNFKHPVVRQQLTEVAQRLQRQHPDANPNEIADMAKKYINDLASALSPQDPNAQKKDGQNQEERGAEFWDDFFNKDKV